MNTTGRKTAYLTVVFCAGLLLVGGCKDLFHPEESADPPVQYTVSYDANGATGTPPAAQTVNAGGSVTIAGQGDLSREGYVFIGWSTGVDGTGTAYSEGESYAPADSVTLYAQWTIQYIVSYDANGATGTPPVAQTVNAGSSLTFAGQQGLSYSGHIFTGWNTDAGGMGTPYSAGDLYTPIASVTLYAQWIPGTPTQYTVTFNADGGTPLTQTKTVDSGDWVGVSNMPAEPTKSGYSFDGWYTETNGGGNPFTATTTVSGDITVYAKWIPVMPENLSLNDTLAWISNNAVEGGSYTITVKNNESIVPQILSYDGKNISIALNGGTTERIVILSESGSLFTLGSGVTLTLDNNVTLQGRSNNTASLVRVNSGGTLVINTGAKVTGNTFYSTSTSYSDSYSYGAGVYVDSGFLTMNGGTISNNTSSSTSTSYSYSYGGGVYITNGIFTMNGGTISNNTSSSYNSHSYYNSSSYGGGVFVNGGAFTMSNGTISGNTASPSSSYISHGGGVSVGGGTFTMSGGTFSGNTSYYGGGVYVGGGTFTKQSDGTIYGSNADGALKNTASGGSYGHAVYVYVLSPSARRNTTADVGVTLDSTVSGSEGGWE
jgi:uncharacterized repeat protein (TIGR02543 family)